MLALLLIFALILGLWLIVRGWAGRRVGDSPHCARCNFDLTGSYPLVQKCPECGADLAPAEAAAAGRWQRRWRVCLIGILFVVFGGTGLVLKVTGSLSTPSLVGHLSTGTVIEWSLRRPDSPIADAGRFELVRRFVDGTLSVTEQESVLEAVLDALESPAHASDQGVGSLLSMSVRSGSPAMRQDIADFLIRRHGADNQPWPEEWGILLGRLREQGMVPSDDWKTCLTRAYAPKPWIASSQPVRPGEEFVLTLSPGARPIFVPETLGISFDLPQGTGVVAWIGNEWEDDLWLGSPGWECPVLVLRAPEAEGDFDIAAHLINEPVLPPSIRGKNPPKPEGWRLTGHTTLLVRSAPTATDEDDALARWLSMHLMPAAVGPSGNLYGGGYSDTTQLVVVMSGDRFIARGTLVLAPASGPEQELCTFSVYMDGKDASSTLRYDSGSHSSFGSSSSDMPTVRLYIPETARSAPKDTRLLIRIDELTLPDGRTHAGPDPIEVELPRELLVPASD